MFNTLKKNFILFTAIMLLMVTMAGYGQTGEKEENNQRTGTIDGRLLDLYTRRPLPGADVAVRGTSLLTVTGAAGEFAFKHIPVGSYVLTFTFPGMVPQVKTDVIVKSNRTTTLTVDMEMIPMTDETVTVAAGYFNRVPDRPANTVSFSNEEIRRAPGAGGDLGRIIAALPSIARVSDQVNNLAVRGGSADENLFLVDNIEIPNINHFPLQGSAGGAICLLNVDFIEDVDFYAGGFSTIYGDRLSSVLDVTFREGSHERFNGQLSLDMAGAGLTAEGPLFGNKGSWMFSARRSYLDLLVDILDAGAAVTYSDFQGKAVYQLSPRNKITFLGVMGIDKSTVTQDDAAELGESSFGQSRTREYTAGLNWFHMWNDKGYTDTSLSLSYTRFDYDFFKTVSGMPNLDNISGDRTGHLRSVSSFTFNHTHKMRFGFEIKGIRSRYDYVAAAYTDVLGNTVPEARKTIDTRAGKFAAFADYSLTLFSPLTLNLGLRADYFTYNKLAHVSPRASVTYRLNGKTSLSASAGIFHQYLSLLLLYQNQANKDLNDPMAYQYSLGLNHLFNDNTRLTVEAYYKSYRHFPINPAQPSLCLLDDLFGGTMFGDAAFVDSGKARSYGIEFVLQKKLKEKIYGMISGSLSSTQYRDLEGVWRSRVFDNQYIFAVQGGYKPNKKWEFSLRWIIAGGMPYTPFDMETSEALNTGIYDTARINAERMPAYHSLNVRFDRRYYFSGSNLTFYFSVWNAYNRENVASYYWNEIKNQPDFTYQFNLLPVIGLEYEF